MKQIGAHMVEYTRYATRGRAIVGGPMATTEIPAVRPALWSSPRSIGRRAVSSPGALVAVLVYVVAALVILRPYLVHPGAVHIRRNEGDEYMFEWLLSVTAQSVTHLHNPLFSATVNAPMGINLMANTGIIPLGILFTPVTLLFGAPVSFGWILLGNLIATALVWRWFLNRHLPAVEGGSPAWRSLLVGFGGLALAFGPGMISHTLSHPNLTAQWLLPAIIDRVLRMRAGERLVRHGIVLGVLVTLQAFLSEELLFITAVTLAVLVLCYTAQRPKEAWTQAPALARGIGVSIVTAGLLLAYPLWFQFAGPQSYSRIPDSPLTHSADLKSFLLAPAQSVLGNPPMTRLYSPNYTEQESFLGWPLLVLALLIAAWRAWRDAIVHTCTLCVVILAVLSWGPSPAFAKHTLGFHGLWYYVEGLPGFTDALPVRIALSIFPFVIVMVVYNLLLAEREHVAIRGVAGIATIAAMVPLIATPVAVANRDRIPQWVSSGEWRQCAGTGTVVTVPLVTDAYREALRWVAETNGALRIPQMPLFVPGPDGVATIGPAPRPTSALLARVDASGKVPAVTDKATLAKNQTRLAADLAYWQAGCVAVMPDAAHPQADQQMLTALFGRPGTLEGGVWTWKVSS